MPTRLSRLLATAAATACLPLGMLAGTASAATSATAHQAAGSRTAHAPKAAEIYLWHVRNGHPTLVTAVAAPDNNRHPAPVRPDTTFGCNGNGCYKLDPVATNCSIGGYPVNGYTWSTPYGIPHLMYGPNCHANWAEVDNSSAGVDFGVFNQPGQKQTWYIHPGYNYGWTNMVDGYPPAGASIGTPSNYYCEAQFAVTNLSLCVP